MLHRKRAGGHGELDEPRHFLDFFLLHKLERIEVLNLTSNAAAKLGGVELGNRAYPVLTGTYGVPGLIGAVANRTQQPDSRDYDSSRHETLPWRLRAKSATLQQRPYFFALASM